jgi:hypothetical protein
MCDLFTSYASTVANWKHAYFGAAYSTRIKAAIADMKFAIAEAEKHPEIGVQRCGVQCRDDVIEECAKIADKYWAREVATQIRALAVSSADSRSGPVDRYDEAMAAIDSCI